MNAKNRNMLLKFHSTATDHAVWWYFEDVYQIKLQRVFYVTLDANMVQNDYKNATSISDAVTGSRSKECVRNQIFSNHILFNNLKHAVLLKDCLLRKLITWNSFHYEMNFHRNIRILKCLKYILQLYLCFICKWMYNKCVNVRSCCPTKK